MPTVSTADGAAALHQELVEVEQAVLASLADLYMPFAQLVQAQWRRNHPLIRGAFVLTAGDSGSGDSGASEERGGYELRRQRIYLAAAMETLRLALGVHTGLLAPDVQDVGASSGSANIDRSLLGSTVLAGDFCFSRSAGLAAKTGSPVIVDLFAAALQRVSEGSLRHLFRPGEDAYDEERELCVSGIAAANELAALSAAERDVDQLLGVQLLERYRAGAPLFESAFSAINAGLAPQRRARWQALAAWLESQSGA